MTIHRKAGHIRGEGWVIGYLGRLALTRLQLEEAKAYYHQYLKISEKRQDQHSKGVCLSFLGEIALVDKEYLEAEKILHQAFDILHKVHDLQSEGWVLTC